MIKIGDFAKLFNVNIKTVRFYEKKGLLHPIFVDNFTGYRYYDERNVDEMSEIIFFKNLGFSLQEIKNYDKNMLKDKIEQYKIEIQKLSQNINILYSLSKKESEVNYTKTFINDENAIGKWRLIGLAKTKEDYLNNNNLDLNDIENDDISINELYLMDKGQEYWVIKWTKNIIFICDRENPYEIIGDTMFIKFMDPIDKKSYKLAVYERVDRKKYKIEDIKFKDDINISFEEDQKLIGIWQSVDFVTNPETFNPAKKSRKNKLFLKKISVFPDGTAIASYETFTRNIYYTKNKIINLCVDDTLSNYIYREFNCKLYIIIEWKSGDYMFGKKVNGYYVLEKI